MSNHAREAAAESLNVLNLYRWPNPDDSQGQRKMKADLHDVEGIIQGAIEATRRERIATAALKAIITATAHSPSMGFKLAAEDAVEYADALIAELDKKEDR